MKAANIIDGIMTHGRGALLAKFQVESAYFIIPVHSHDRYLLGMKWHGQYFIDLALPCRLRPAPLIFSSFAELLEWIIKHNYKIQFLLHLVPGPESETLPPLGDFCRHVSFQSFTQGYLKNACLHLIGWWVWLCSNILFLSKESQVTHTKR